MLCGMPTIEPFAAPGVYDPPFYWQAVKVTGGQRFAEPHELAYQDPERVANVGTRAEELAAWNELGFDRCTAGIPGLHNTDEGLYEFIDDCRTAGIDFFDRQPVPTA